MTLYDSHLQRCRERAAVLSFGNPQPVAVIYDGVYHSYVYGEEKAFGVILPPHRVVERYIDGRKIADA